MQNFTASTQYSVQPKKANPKKNPSMIHERPAPGLLERDEEQHSNQSKNAVNHENHLGRQDLREHGRNNRPTPSDGVGDCERRPAHARREVLGGEEEDYAEVYLFRNVKQSNSKGKDVKISRKRIKEKHKEITQSNYRNRKYRDHDERLGEEVGEVLRDARIEEEEGAVEAEEDLVLGYFGIQAGNLTF